MKQRYPKVPLFLALFTLLFYLPSRLHAQCMCSDGSPAVTELHNVSVNFATNTITPLSIPKFQPSTGTLVCVNAKIYLTSVLRMKLENDDSLPIDYNVRYVRVDSLTGPGISPAIYGDKTKNYGPYPLQPTDGNPYSGPDFVGIGPDTIYNKKLYEVTTTDVVNYLGTGTINFLYKSQVNTYAIGSDYYGLTVSSQNKLDFTVTYSYCNNIILKLNLKSFQAILKDKDNVLLSWTTLNENKNNNYEIELSENGSSFRTVGNASAKLADGASAKYNYQYPIDQPVNGKLYFRIKQINGKAIAYSDVRIINLGADAFPGVRIFPNPVVRNINMEFDRPISGDFHIELTNQVGQVVYATSMKLNNNTALQMQLNNPPPPGIYFLRAKDAASAKVYSGKLLFTK